MKQAAIIIATLQTLYNENNKNFDFVVSQFVSGDTHKGLRQDIMKTLNNGQPQPAAKCGIYAVSDALQAHFKQPVLF